MKRCVSPEFKQPNRTDSLTFHAKCNPVIKNTLQDHSCRDNEIREDRNVCDCDDKSARKFVIELMYEHLDDCKHKACERRVNMFAGIKKYFCYAIEGDIYITYHMRQLQRLQRQMHCPKEHGI